MATFNINIVEVIEAHIVGGNRVISAGDAEILDPVTDSFSNAGTVNFWLLTVTATDPGITFVDILNNGVNSRITAEGSGDITVQLEVRDTLANVAFTTITVTVI